MSEWAENMVRLVERSNEIRRMQMDEILNDGGSISFKTYEGAVLSRATYTVRRNIGKCD